MSYIGGRIMEVVVFDYCFSDGQENKESRDAYVLACLAVRSLFQIDQTCINEHVTNGCSTLPKAICASEEIGKALAAIFNGFLTESVGHTCYTVKRIIHKGDM